MAVEPKATAVSRVHRFTKEIQTVEKLFRFGMVVALLGMFAAPAWSQETGDVAEDQAVAAAPLTADQQIELASRSYGKLSAGIGAGLVLLGVGFGIGRIGGQAVEGMSRQPEAAANIQTAMIVAAALIEGAGFFALVVCILI